MRLTARIVTIWLAAGAVSGCVTNVSGYRVPGADVENLETLLLVPPDAATDDRGLRLLISQEFERRGYRVLAYDTADRSVPGTAILDYDAAWEWDITTFLTELRIALYEPDNRLLIGQAHSHQSSFARRAPEEIVRRAVDELLGSEGETQ